MVSAPITENSAIQNKIPKCLGILLCYNDGDILEEQINYLLSQNHDIVAWDHGSDDNTKNVLDKFNDIFIQRKYLPREFDFYDLYPAMSRNLIDNFCNNYDIISWPDQDEFLEGPSRDKTYFEYLKEFYNSPYTYIQFNNYLYWFTKEDDLTKETTKRMFYYSLHSKCGPRIRAWKAKVTNIRWFNHNLLDGQRFPLFFNLRHYPFRSQEQFFRRINKDRVNLERDGANFHYNNITKNLESISKMTKEMFHYDNGKDDLNPEEIFDWNIVYGRRLDKN